MLLASFPSPSTGVLHLGPIPLRAYAFCIVLGIIAASVIAEKRLQARGAPEGSATEIATWGVPFGLVGARLYHVITTPDPYFGKYGHPIDALKIWNGGLGIWGAIGLGFVGGVIAVRRLGLPVRLSADAIAPALAVAQAIGRFGNYFNQELYGRPSTLPWAVRIDPQNRVDPNVGTYQPTFLYESLWNLGVAGVCLWADRRFKLGCGRVFALYVALYCIGRSWIEALRVDDAHRFFGLRLNDYVCLVCFLVAVAYLFRHRGRREPQVGAPQVGAPLVEAPQVGTPQVEKTGASEGSGTPSHLPEQDEESATTSSSPAEPSGRGDN